MKIVDRIVIQKALSMFFDFLLKIVQLILPKNNDSPPHRRKIFPRIRKDHE